LGDLSASREGFEPPTVFVYAACYGSSVSCWFSLFRESLKFIPPCMALRPDGSQSQPEPEPSGFVYFESGSMMYFTMSPKIFFCSMS